MFLPTGEHHVLLMRNQDARREAEATYADMGYVAASRKPGSWQRTRRTFGKTLIRLGRWICGSERSTVSGHII